MKKYYLCLIILLISSNSFAEITPDPAAEVLKAPLSSIPDTDSYREKSFNWIKNNVSDLTRLPLSFYVPDEIKDKLYSQMGRSQSINGIIERGIVKEGLCIYDGALWQIVLTLIGGEDYLETASIPSNYYWEGSLGALTNIRAGWPAQPFIYNPRYPKVISSSLRNQGKRGFIFRILNAHGKYNHLDPLDGKKRFVGFPNWSRIHWEDWKPIAGENAWVVLAALHLHYKKHPGFLPDSGQEPPPSVFLQLAEELGRAAMFLQAENGGVRMAPLGTFYYPHLNEDGEDVYELSGYPFSGITKMIASQAFQEINLILKNGNYSEPIEYTWYYNQISTENNIAWYAAFRMLYQLTGKEKYRNAMNKIEQYFEAVWNPKEKIFYQGLRYQKGEWIPNKEHFASDVQYGSILVLGPAIIDEWFGEGSVYQIWEQTKNLSGCYDQANHLRGIGYTEEHDRISIEWTASAIIAARMQSEYYRVTHPDWAAQAQADAVSMRQGIEQYRYDLSEDQAAYSYSSQRGWIPFGWFSHSPEVMSMASTTWIMLCDQNINPFRLIQQPLEPATINSADKLAEPQAENDMAATPQTENTSDQNM